MSREIPFFELFAQLQLSPELRLKLLGAVIASACIHQDTLSMELAMIVKHPLEPSDLDELNSCPRSGRQRPRRPPRPGEVHQGRS